MEDEQQPIAEEPDVEVHGHPVEDHITFFTNAHGLLTVESMCAGHVVLGLNYKTSLKEKAIIGIAHEANAPLTAHGVASISNPMAIGPWQEGKFCQEEWRKMKRAAMPDLVTGKRFFTKKILLDMLHAKQKRTDPTATRIGGCCALKLKWSRVTEGSINEMFRVFSDRWDKVDENWQQTMSEDQMLLFYTNQPQLYRQKSQGDFNIPKPDTKTKSRCCWSGS